MTFIQNLMRKLTRKTVTANQGQPGTPPGYSVKSTYKDIDPAMLEQKIAPYILQTRKILTPAELPPAIRENPTNYQNYVSIANRLLQQLQPAPAPQKATPVSPPASGGISKAFQAKVEIGILADMVDHLRRTFARHEDYDLEDVEANLPPSWKKYMHLWPKAVQQYQSELPAPEDVNRVTDLNEIELRRRIEPIVRKKGEVPSPESLPPDLAQAIRGSDSNLEMYYRVGDAILAESGQAQPVGGGSAGVAEPAKFQFTEPLAKIFYKLYLSPDVDNAEEFHLLFQGKVSDRYAPQNASDIAAIDDLFKKRVPEGHAGGRGAYDPVVGYFVSNYGKQNAGIFIKAYRKVMDQPTGEIDAHLLARFIAKKGMDKAEEKFQELMYLQDPSVAKYIAEKTRMKGQGGASGALIDKETGGVRDVGADQSTGEVARNTETRGVGSQVLDSVTQGLLEIPKQIEGLGSIISGNLSAKIEQLKSTTPGWQNNPNVRRQISKLDTNARLIDAYTSAVRESMEEMHKKSQSGGLTDEEIKAMIAQNLIQVDTSLGKVKIIPNTNMGKGDITQHLDISALAPPSKVLPYFARKLRESMGDKAAAQVLGKGDGAEPFDFSSLDWEKMSGPQKQTAKARFDEAKKRMYMKSQFMLNDVADPLMEALQSGQTDRSTALSLLKLLRPHAQSTSMGNVRANHGQMEEARAWAMSHIPNAKRVPIIDQETGIPRTNPDTGQPETTFALNESGQPEFEHFEEKIDESGRQKSNYNWLTNDMESGKIPRVTREQVARMSPKDFAAWVKGVSDAYYRGGEMDGTKRKVADYFAQILDHGRDPSEQSWKTRSAMIYDIARNALIKIASLLDLKNGLGKYASSDHISEMMVKTRIEANRKISVLWMK